LACLWFFACVGWVQAEPIANWSANYPPCKRHSELLKYGPLNLGVRLATANPVLAEEFKWAMNFWAKVLDLDWHEDSTENCAIQVVDGERELFEPTPASMVARSQFPDRPQFQGWIVFNPAVKLNRTELYRIAVHEIGHMLGLRHSNSTSSLMYGLDLETSETLDVADLTALAGHHKLRIVSLTKPVILTNPR
jgi:Matrixin